MTQDEQAFEAFWVVYPRRIGKGAAKIEFTKALKRASFETIMNGLLAQIPANLKRDDPQFIPHARTWLHQSRWDDDIEQPKQRNGIIGVVKREVDDARQNQGGNSYYGQFILSASKH